MTKPGIRDVLKDARQIAIEEFGDDTVREIPLLVTNIALAMVHLSQSDTGPGDRTG